MRVKLDESRMGYRIVNGDGQIFTCSCGQTMTIAPTEQPVNGDLWLACPKHSADPEANHSAMLVKCWPFHRGD